MDAGQLNRRIEITRITGGVQTDPWSPPSDPITTTVASIRAQIVQQSTEEFMQSYGESQQTAIVFRIRYRSDVHLTDQVVYDTHTFDLIEVKEIGLREGLELRCRAVS